MGKYLIAYLAVAAIMVGLDLLWLRYVGRALYEPALGGLLAEHPNTGAAVAFYLVYTVGIVYFALAPAMKDGQWTTAALNGALLGFIAYATYDLTNWATLRGWPGTIALLDMGWGALLTGFSAGTAFWVLSVLRV